MTEKDFDKYADISYVGEAGNSFECVKAIERYVVFGDEITKAVILSSAGRHCILLTINRFQIVAVKSGFTSGYRGTGPRAFVTALKLLLHHAVEIEEREVPSDLIDRINNSALSQADMQLIGSAEQRSPESWWEDINLACELPASDQDLWKHLPPTIPYAIIDSRLVDIVTDFSNDPDQALIHGYRRLEDIIRKRCSLDEHGTKLFAQSFRSHGGTAAKLIWPELNQGESEGRAALFIAIYMAYRNPRAHQERVTVSHSPLVELMLLNTLFLLEKDAIENRQGEA